jgi:hypothetical protein
MARSAAAGTTLVLAARFYSNNALFDPYDVQAVKIYSPANVLLHTLVPQRQSIGFYQVSYTVPSSAVTGSYVDRWTWQAEVLMATNTQDFAFTVTNALLDAEAADHSDTVAVPIHVETRSKPTWLYHVGLEQTEDVGNGMGIGLVWRTAVPSNPAKTVYYNVYYASKRLDVLTSDPVAITANTYATLNIPPGNQSYFAVRAVEYNPTLFQPAELTQIGPELYQYPASQVLQAPIDAYGATVQVLDATAFPSRGYLQLDYEVLYYDTRTATTFTITTANRGAFQTIPTDHIAGTTVKLFRGIEEQNSVLVAGTADWSKSNPAYNPDAIGEVNVDVDGYRANAVDLVTTDLSASDANTADFPSYDYAGYHRPSMQSYFKGACINSYAWGELNGQRGVGLQDQNLARLDMMLQTTGEGVILLRRKQTGRRCRCIDLRHEHPTQRCQYCYGTGFEGGFDRYVNTRAISEFETNTQGKILVRIDPWKDDVKLSASNGLMQDVELSGWTINLPTIKDRSLLVRFNEDGTEEFRYAVLDVTRSKLMFGLTGQQKFKLQRLDKTDIVYSYRWIV